MKADIEAGWQEYMTDEQKTTNENDERNVVVRVDEQSYRKVLQGYIHTSVPRSNPPYFAAKTSKHASEATPASPPINRQHATVVEGRHLPLGHPTPQSPPASQQPPYSAADAEHQTPTHHHHQAPP